MSNEHFTKQCLPHNLVYIAILYSVQCDGHVYLDCLGDHGADKVEEAHVFGAMSDQGSTG